ncbi:hypothetical protein KBC75_05375 [Candidatus Shapirobacteria bacterium]|nr:hypothetical protein [Candidatus Shapirobacteria bacterium]
MRIPKLLYVFVVVLVLWLAFFAPTTPPAPATEPTSAPEYPKVTFSPFVETGSDTVDYQLTEDSYLVHLSASSLGGSNAVFTPASHSSSDHAVFVVAEPGKNMVVLLNDKGEIIGSFTIDVVVTYVTDAEIGPDGKLSVWFSTSSGEYLWTKLGDLWSIEKIG